MYREEAEGRSSSDMLAEVLLTDSPGGEYSPFNKTASTSPVLNTGPHHIFKKNSFISHLS